VFPISRPCMHIVGWPHDRYRTLARGQTTVRRIFECMREVWLMQDVYDENGDFAYDHDFEGLVEIMDAGNAPRDASGALLSDSGEVWHLATGN